jgi:uncharacterized iron-regulated membrane protein
MAKENGSRKRIQWRRQWRNIHLWLGLSLFVVLAPLGLSGSLLVWDDAIDKLQHPRRYEVDAGSRRPADYLAAATWAFAGRASPAQIRLPEGPGLPVTVIGYAPSPVAPGQRPPQLTAWIDPASGHVLDVADPRQDLRGVIHRLHGNLLLTQNGRPVVGWLGLAMLVSSLTGLIIWWPRNGGLAQAVRWKRSPSTFSNLHQLTGFLVCIPLVLLSLSGAYIAFPKAMSAILPAPQGLQRAAGPRDNDRRFALPLPAPHTRLVDALAAAGAAAPPGARLASISLPTAGERPAWRIQFQGAGGPVSVQVDDTHGKVRRPHGPDLGGREGPGGDPVLRFMRGLHDGSALGIVWKVIIAFAGLAPAALGVTGAVIWATRRLRAKPS